MVTGCWVWSVTARVSVLQQHIAQSSTVKSPRLFRFSFNHSRFAPRRGAKREGRRWRKRSAWRRTKEKKEISPGDVREKASEILARLGRRCWRYPVKVSLSWRESLKLDQRNCSREGALSSGATHNNNCDNADL